MEPEVHRNGATTPAKPTTYSLLKLDKEAIVKFWPAFIRPGLLSIKRHDKRSGEWVPEHVRQRIEAGFAGTIFCECHLVMPVSASEPAGFVVLTMYNDEFVQVPQALFVWIAWCEKAPLRKVLPSILPQLEKRARDMGLRYVAGITSRWQAWLHRIFLHGYSVHQVIFKKDLYPDE